MPPPDNLELLSEGIDLVIQLVHLVLLLPLPFRLGIAGACGTVVVVIVVGNVRLVSRPCCSAGVCVWGHQSSTDHTFDHTVDDGTLLALLFLARPIFEHTG